jgi:hypothetical protein
LSKIIDVLSNSCASYRNKPTRLAEKLLGGFSNDALTKYGNDCIKNFTDFLFFQMFLASSPQHICHLITHKDQTQITMYDAYYIMDTELWVKADKMLMAINKEEQPEPEVAAF